MKSKKPFILLFLIAISANRLLAWADKGHEMIAQIAKENLSHNVLDSVQFYLRETSFEKAALWMDDIRKNHDYDSLKPRHYVNIDRDKTYVKVSQANIINELDLVIDQLLHKKLKTRLETKTTLMILFHLVGDLHQPLHVGYARDRGGNDIHLNFNHHKTNLHRLWDVDMIEHEKISLEDCHQIINTFSKADRKNIQKISVLTWMNESRTYLKNVYSYQSENIDSAYVAKNSLIIKTQLSKAGLRLAAVLNNCFEK